MTDPIWDDFDRFVVFGPKALKAPRGTPAHRFPALTAYQRGDVEVGSPLWRAACWESSARHAIALGQFEGAKQDLIQAREILLDAMFPEGDRGRARGVRAIPARRAGAATC